ncbi:hypothetical protein AMTRI_Chr09g13810 [Amborella trichopoda]
MGFLSSVICTIPKLGFRRSISRPAVQNLGFQCSNPRLHFASIPPFEAHLRVSAFGFGLRATTLEHRRSHNIRTAHIICALGNGPDSEGDKGKSGGSQIQAKQETDSEAGPPLSTILAGVFVFLLFLWIVGSIVIWIFRLFIR